MVPSVYPQVLSVHRKCETHSRTGMIMTLCRDVSRSRGLLPEATEDSSATTVWWRGAHSQDQGSAQDTEWTHLPGSLRVNMSRVLQRVIQREGDVSSANQTTQRRTEHLVAPQGEGRGRARVCFPRDRLWYRPKLLTKNTRPHACPPKKRLLQ